MKKKVFGKITLSLILIGLAFLPGRSGGKWKVLAQPDMCDTCDCPGSGYEEITCSGDTVYVDCNADLCWTPQLATKTWDTAVSYCNNSGYGGKSDWALSDKSTLQNLCNSGSCSKNCFGASGSNYFFWSSTEYNASNAYYVYFDNCTANYYSKGSYFSTRCVREGVAPPPPPTLPAKTMVDDATTEGKPGGGSGGGVVSAGSITQPTEDEDISEREWVVRSYDGVDFPDYEKFKDIYDFDGATTINQLAQISSPGRYKIITDEYSINSPNAPCKQLGVSAVIFIDGSLIIRQSFSDELDNPLMADLLVARQNCKKATGEPTSAVFIVKDDITIDPAVNNIYGIFYAGGTISTGSSSNRLYVFGSLLAGDPTQPFVLGRDLGEDNPNYPAEQIIYMPQYLLDLGSEELLGQAKITWKEVVSPRTPAPTPTSPPTQTSTPTPTPVPTSTPTPVPPTPTPIPNMCDTCACDGTSYESITCSGDTVYVDCNADLCWTPQLATKTWDTAVSYCNNSGYGGKSDWALSDKSTLQNLCNSGSCSKNCFGASGSNYFFWSSTEYNASNAYYVYFDNCTANYYSKGSYFSTRCVRGE